MRPTNYPLPRNAGSAVGLPLIKARNTWRSGLADAYNWGITDRIGLVLAREKSSVLRSSSPSLLTNIGGYK
jgi:hypothetical protein